MKQIACRLVVLLLLGGIGFAEAKGQEGDAGDKWSWRWDFSGESGRVPREVISAASVPADTAVIRKSVLSYWADRGYLSAAIDAFAVNRDKRRVTIYLDRSCRYAFNRPDIQYPMGFGEGEQERYEAVGMEGERYSVGRLEREIMQIIAFYEERGYPLTAVTVQTLQLDRRPCRVTPVLKVDTGDRIYLSGLRLPPLEHTSAFYVRTAAGVRDSALITPDLMRRVRRNLQQTELFSRVGEPEIIQRNDRSYLQISLDERNPNQIDILAGYVPDATGGGTIIGDGQLKLRHLFWEGSRMYLSFERLRPQVSSLEASFERSWIGGGPVGAGAGFEFYQQDTTYQLRSLYGSASYQLQPGTDLVGTIRRKVSAASDRVGREAPVLDAATTFAGMRLESEQLDRTNMPTEGLRWSLSYETGLKVVTDARADADSIDNRLYQQQLEGYIQPYLPLGRRSVLTMSINGYLMVSGQYTESELIRFGGARSLRGYREDQFMASRMLWGDVEYQYRLDPESYAFVFGAAGTYYRPQLITESSSLGGPSDVLHSVGIGMAYTTRLGILRFSYAISPEDALTNGKVHFGIETLF